MSADCRLEFLWVQRNLERLIVVKRERRKGVDGGGGSAVRGIKLLL